MASVAATCCCAAIAATALLLVTFNVPAIYRAIHTVLFASGRTTDIEMDHGDGVPIYERYILRHDILRLSGRDLSVYPVLNLIGHEYSLTASTEDARDIVSKLCYSVVNYDTELKPTDKEKTHELSDGNITEQVLSHCLRRGGLLGMSKTNGATWAWITTGELKSTRRRSASALTRTSSL